MSYLIRPAHWAINAQAFGCCTTHFCVGGRTRRGTAANQQYRLSSISPANEVSDYRVQAMLLCVWPFRTLESQDVSLFRCLCTPHCTACEAGLRSIWGAFSRSCCFKTRYQISFCSPSQSKDFMPPPWRSLRYCFFPSRPWR
jgi:hypothetical protein